MSAPEPQTPLPSTAGKGRFVPRLTRQRVSLVLLVVAVLGGAGWRYRITRADYRLARGEEALRARDYETVAQFAERLEASGHPDHAALLRAEGLCARNRPEFALAELNKVRPDGPLRLQTLALSGRCLLDLGDLPAARALLSTVVDERPDHADAHRGLAAIAYDLGQLGTAVDHLQRVAELDPRDARPHRLIGLIYKDMGQYARAEDAYRQALERGLPEAGTREVQLELAEVLVRQAKFAEGLAVIDGAPTGAEPGRGALRAECLRGLGRTDEAAAELDRALATHSTAALYRLRGQVHEDRGNAAEAFKCFERAVELAPNDHQAHYYLGRALAGAGRKEEADRAFARDAELRKELDRITALTKEAMEKPWDPGVRRELADVCDRMGKSELATLWRKAAATCARTAPPR
jgi:tetratricopeptide (TPR) repeat protein